MEILTIIINVPFILRIIGWIVMVISFFGFFINLGNFWWLYKDSGFDRKTFMGMIIFLALFCTTFYFLIGIKIVW